MVELKFWGASDADEEETEKQQAAVKAEPAETPNVVSTASSSAAAAPADSPDVIPVSATPGLQPIPSNISTKRLQAELALAASSGVLQGEHLAEYIDIMESIASNAKKGYSNTSTSAIQSMHYIYATSVYKKKPPTP